MRLLDETVYNTAELEARLAEIAVGLEETVALMNQLIAENATAANDPDEYDRRYQQLEQRYQQEEQEHHTMSDQIADLSARRAQAAAARDYLATQPPLEYSDEAWNLLVQKASVNSACDVEVRLNDVF